MPHTSSSSRYSSATRHRWKVLGVGVAANVSFSAAAAGIPTTALWLRSDYQLSTPQLGLVLGALGLGVAISELPWGLATDRWGDRPILLSGLLGTAVALLLMALFIAPLAGPLPAVPWLVAAMCLVGVCGGSVNGASGRAVMRWFAAHEWGLAMSIRQTAVPLGGGLGALILPWLAMHAGFAAVYGVLAALCAATTYFAWQWLHEPPHLATPASTDSAATHGRGPLRDRQVWQVVWAIGLLCIPQFAVLTFATIFLHDVARLGMAGITASMVTVQAGAMIMRVWSGHLTDRLGNRRAYLRGAPLVTGAIFALLAAAVASGNDGAGNAGLVALLVLAGIAVSAWHGVAYTELAVLAGAERAGTALGMANTVVYFALFLTPLAIPYLLAASSWAGVWLAAALCGVLTYPLFPKPRPLTAA